MGLRCTNAFSGNSAGWCWRASALLLLIMMLLTVVSPALTAQQGSPKTSAGQPTAAPIFGDDDALTILDNLQAALQSYNRKKFLGAFDSTKMTGFPVFRTEINNLFARYDSFNVTYHLAQTSVENGNGVALADFGLDAASDSDEMLDLRRHTQLRIVVAWNGKEWKIVDLSPRTIFQ